MRFRGGRNNESRKRWLEIIWFHLVKLWACTGSGSRTGSRDANGCLKGGSYGERRRVEAWESEHISEVSGGCL